MSGHFDATSLRRARRAKRLSQAQLADLVGVSQASISYYERERIAPPDEVRLQLERVLELSETERTNASPFAPPEGSLAIAHPPRARWLATLERFSARVAWLDRPAGPDGGDLALAVDRGSHALLAVLDASGKGQEAAAAVRSLAGVALGAMSAGRAIPQPEDIVEAVSEAARLLLDEDVALTLLLLERRSRRVRLCRLGAPPPLVRSGRTAPWPGKPCGPVGSYIDERVLEDGAMLVVATDGAAELPTRARDRRGLWDSPDFRNLLSKATTPEQVVVAARERLGEAGQPKDDLLLVAASVSSS